jgi:hypothetical protein
MRHRKYIQFGSNLLGFTHGDGAKDKDLHSLALTEARTAFSECDRVYWHCHHVHHKIRKMNGVEIEKDHIGATVIHAAPVSDVTDKCVIEYIRSASASDGWHHRNGYVGAVQAIEAFVYSPRSQSRHVFPSRIDLFKQHLHHRRWSIVLDARRLHGSSIQHRLEHRCEPISLASGRRRSLL